MVLAKDLKNDTAQSNPEIRQFQQADMEEILALQNQIFGGTRGAADWEWKSTHNPYFRDLTAVAASSNRVCAAYTMVGSALNVCGNRVLAGHCTDTIVHPQMRNQGLFLKTALYADQLAKELQVAIAYGYPNVLAMPINLLKLNVRPVAYLHYYSRKINPPDKVLQSLHLLGLPEFCTLIFRGCLVAGLLPRMLLQSLRLARESRVEVTTQVPEQNYEPLWHYEKQREILSFWKDSEYMRWRYERHPHLSPKFFGLYEGDELTALAVLVSVKGEATIADLIVKDRRLQRARYLVSKILMHCCLNDRENKKVVFMGHDRGFFPAVFADFTLLPERDFPFCLRFLSNKEKLEPLAIAAESWTLTGGDTDSLY